MRATVMTAKESQNLINILTSNQHRHHVVIAQKMLIALKVNFEKFSKIQKNNFEKISKNLTLFRCLRM